MLFEWDDQKAASNLAKHAVSFELAQEVWSDLLYVVLPDRVEDGEQRWHAIGMIGAVVVWSSFTAIPSRTTNIASGLSAPERPRHERKRYEQESA